MIIFKTLQIFKPLPQQQQPAVKRTCGSRTVYPHCLTVANWLAVTGWSHMCVFMAGATITGLNINKYR